MCCKCQGAKGSPAVDGLPSLLQSPSIGARIAMSSFGRSVHNPRSFMQAENQIVLQDASVSGSEESCRPQKPSRIQPSCFFVTLFFAVAVFCILVFVMVRVIPEFEKTFVDFDVALPFMTIAVIATSNFLARFWWFLLLLVPLVVLLLVPLMVWLFVKRHTISVSVFNLLSLLVGLFTIVGILIGVAIFIACFRPLLILIMDVSS